MSSSTTEQPRQNAGRIGISQLRVKMGFVWLRIYGVLLSSGFDYGRHISFVITWFIDGTTSYVSTELSFLPAGRFGVVLRSRFMVHGT